MAVVILFQCDSFIRRALDFLCDHLKVPCDGDEAMELVREKTGNVLPLTAPLGNETGDGVGLEDCEVVILAPKGTPSSVQNTGEGSKQLVGVSSQQHISSPIFQPDSQPALDAESVVKRGSLEHATMIPRQLDDVVQDGRNNDKNRIIRCDGLKPEEGSGGLCFLVTLGKSSSTKEKIWNVVGVDPASTTVRMLKSHLERETKIPLARIKLLYKGILNDDMKFCETKVKQACKVMMMGS
eukprot:536403_1